MDLDFLKGGAIVGLIVGFWDKIKAFLWRLISVLIQKVEIGTEELHEAVIAYLITSYKYSKIYDKNYGATNAPMRNGKYGLVGFEKFGNNSIVFWKSRVWRSVPFLFSTNPENVNNNNSNNGHGHGRDETNTSKIYSTILCFRGTLKTYEIIENAVKMRNNLSWHADEQDEKITRFDIFYLPNTDTNHYAYFTKSNEGFAWYRQKHFNLLGIKSEEIGRSTSSNGKALENLFFPKKVTDLIDVIELWVKSKEWYKEKNIPWKRGWLLYGVPGTGKTALARAFAEDLNMPIYVYSLSQMSNNDLTNAWKNMQSNVPCIALIEDIDNVFHGRKNISNNNILSQLMTDNNDSQSNNSEASSIKTPLTFDCLLNCLDGVDKSDGVFTIITTNDIGKIDEAIGKPVVNGGTTEFVTTRPGRIDKAIELGYMEKENKIQMANKILKDFDDKLKEVLKYIDTNNDETPAQFQEYCAQIAIQEYWKKEKQKS